MVVFNVFFCYIPTNLYFCSMNQTKDLVRTIVKGLEEKKGIDISVTDLTGADGSICDYFVICTGNSPTQVDALTDSVEETVRVDLGEKPVNIVGKENGQWVAIDYTDVIVHIFLPDVREFYDLEGLWE